MKNLKVFASLILVLLFSSGRLAAGEADLILTEAQIRAFGIQTLSDEPQSLHNTQLPARVTVPTAQMRVVAAPLGGVIESLLVAPGDRVKRGQPLARLSSREALELQRDAAQAGSQAALLKQNLQRDEKLFAEGLIAEARLQNTRSAATQAAAQASERRQGLQLAGTTNKGGIAPWLTLNAPIDGVVLEQSAQTGQRVDAATPLYRIASLTPLWLEIQAPLAVAGELRPGQKLRVVEFDLPARLIAIGRSVDMASQSVLLRAEVNDGAERLTAGQMLKVELPLESASRGTQRLPATAVVRDGKRTLVFVLLGDNKQNGGKHFAAQEVAVIAQGGDSVTVDGLKGGEKVVVRGASALKAMLTGVGRE